MNSWHPTAISAQPVRRRQSRLRVRLPARLTTLTDTRDGVLYDLCMFGAKLQLDLALQPGSEVVLEWAGYDAFGMVVWQRSGFCGISFIDPITAAALIATRDHDDVARMQGDRELNRQAAKAWVSGDRRF